MYSVKRAGMKACMLWAPFQSILFLAWDTLCHSATTPTPRLQFGLQCFATLRWHQRQQAQLSSRYMVQGYIQIPCVHMCYRGRKWQRKAIPILGQSLSVTDKNWLKQENKRNVLVHI